MTGNVVAAAGRIAAIRQRMEAIAPPPRDFGSVLAAATGTVRSGPVAATKPSAVFGAPTVGILGTRLKLAPGAATGSWVGATTDWARRLPEAARPWVGPIRDAAREAGLDPRMLAALVWTESSFRPDAVSSAGAVGLTQLMPATAADLGVDPVDPIQNLEGGARYLARNLAEFGRLDLAAAAYNAGPGAVRENGGHPYIDEPGGYVDRIVSRYRRLGGTHP